MPEAFLGILLIISSLHSQPFDPLIWVMTELGIALLPFQCRARKTGKPMFNKKLDNAASVKAVFQSHNMKEICL